MIAKRLLNHAGRAAFFLAVASAACADRALAPQPCKPPQELLAVIAEPVALAQPLNEALAHAAGPLATALETSTDAVALPNAISSVAANMEANRETACLALRDAAARLAAIPETPETRAEREGTRLVLALAANALRLP